PRTGEPLRLGSQVAKLRSVLPVVSTETKVLFFRDFKRFTGGDLKVWDYFNHVRSSPHHEAHIRFTENSVWNDDNPCNAAREHVVRFGEAFRPDVLFLSGVDWRMIER